jgi:hypothetical protein
MSDNNNDDGVDVAAEMLYALAPPPPPPPRFLDPDAIGVNQFHAPSGTYACTAIAVAAVASVLIDVAPNLAPDDAEQARVRDDDMWQRIVCAGAKLWTAFRHANATSPLHVECSLLLAERRVPLCDLFASAVEVAREEHGHTDAAVAQTMDPGAGVQLLGTVVRGITPYTGAVITATSGDPYVGYGAAAADDDIDIVSELPVEVSVAVMRPTRAETLWVFDSHGTEHTGSAALLCRCQDAAAAVRTLFRVLPPRAFFQATILRSRPSPPPPTHTQNTA